MLVTGTPMIRNGRQEAGGRVMSYNLTRGYEGAVQMDAGRCLGRGITPAVGEKSPNPAQIHVLGYCRFGLSG